VRKVEAFVHERFNLGLRGFRLFDCHKRSRVA
jgi:hypothetical protein